MTRSGVILVVEDEDTIRDLLATILEDNGYTVQTAANGQVALHLLQNYRPGLILLDLMMPIMDGVTFYHRLRQQWKRLPPIVALSADRMAEQKIRHLDVCAFLPKPFDVDALLHIIQQNIPAI